MLTVKNVPQNDMLSLVRGAQTFEDLRAVLVWIRNKFSITNVTYHAIKMPNCSVMHPLTISTYKQEWISHYVEKKYFRVDPVINYGFHSFLPFDWSALDCNSTATRDFFSDADRFSVGRQGASIPIRGPANGRALFTVTSNSTAEAWRDQHSLLILQLHLVSYVIHDRVVQISGLRPNVADTNLSSRELQCLQAIANGLAPKQVAGTLGLSATAVNMFLRNARRKLSATNMAEAAVKAVSLDLIQI